ncbi:unnamed protein product [Rotaria sp. Silwood1]|nr:unnamed protein product [Rotaria sp. Silwood1]
MTASPATNAALLQSLQRVRERQSRVDVVSPSRPQNNVPNNSLPIETITTGPINERPKVTTPVKVVRLPKTVIQEPSNTSPVYIQYPQQTYPTNTKLIRTEPQGKLSSICRRTRFTPK